MTFYAENKHFYSTSPLFQSFLSIHISADTFAICCYILVTQGHKNRYISAALWWQFAICLLDLSDTKTPKITGDAPLDKIQIDETNALPEVTKAVVFDNFCTRGEKLIALGEKKEFLTNNYQMRSKQQKKLLGKPRFA